MSEVIRFHQQSLFSGLTGTIDFENCIIHGVSLIQPNVEAEGHGLFVDDVTATQLFEAAKAKGKVPVNMDHGSGIVSMNGTIRNVRMDNGRPRGDWHLLKSDPTTEAMLERASEMAECFGLSAAFKGDPKGVTCNGRQCARVEKLLSFDIVVRPAANNDGLFSAKDTDPVDISKNLESQQRTSKNSTLTFMADQQQQAEPTIAELVQAIQGLTQQVQQQAEMQQQIIGHINEGVTGQQPNDQRAQLEALYNASDEQLAELGITRDEVTAAVNEYNSTLGEQGQEQGQEGDGQFEGSYGNEAAAGAGASAGAAAGGGSETSAAFHALQREFIQLKAKFAAKEKAEIQFAEAQEANKVEQKFIALAHENKQLREFSEKVVAHNEALELAVRTGTGPVAAGVAEGTRLFSSNESGQLHPFQQRILQIQEEKKCTPGAALMFASSENPAIHADYLQSLGSKRTIHA